MKWSSIPTLFYTRMLSNVLTIVFPIFVIFNSMQAFGLSCKNLFKEESQISIDLSAVTLSRSKALKHYAKAIDAALSLTNSAGLIFPNKPIKIFVHPFFNYEGERASLGYDHNIVDITVPYRWIIEHRSGEEFIELANSPKRTLPVFWHEVGHSILRENAERSRSAVLRNYFFIQRQMVDELMNHIEKLEALEASKLSVPAKKVQLSKLENKHTEKLLALEKKIPKEYHVIIKSLDEFLADFFAVLLSENPKAISEANSVNYQGNKSFTLGLFSHDFAARDFKQPDGVEKGSPQDIYTYFSQTRKYLYENYLKNTDALVGQNRGPTLSKIFEAADLMLLDLDVENNTVSIEKMNERFMRAIDSTFR